MTPVRECPPLWLAITCGAIQRLAGREAHGPSGKCEWCLGVSIGEGIGLARRILDTQAGALSDLDRRYIGAAVAGIAWRPRPTTGAP